MNADTVFVLNLLVVFIGGLALLEVRSRQRRNTASQSASPSLPESPVGIARSPKQSAQFTNGIPRKRRR